MKLYKINDIINCEFLKIPKAMFANEEYRRLSSDAKLTFALLYDRLSLSQMNGWINENDEVYLIYTREEISEDLGLTYKKAISAFKELLSAGLITEQRCGRGCALMYIVVFELLCKEGEEYEDYKDWVDKLKNWCCEGDDCGNTEVGNYTGHYAGCNENELIAELVLCKLGNIFGERGEKTDSCCKTSCCNDEAEEDNARLAEDILCNGNNELSLGKAFWINNRCGCAEICKTAVNESEADSRNKTGNTDHISLLLGCLVALLLNGEEETDGKNDTAQHIHCLVTGNDTFLDNRFNADNIADFADWIYNT